MGSLSRHFHFFPPLTVWIGLRYTRAKRRTRFISFVATSAMLGVALGVMALITVLAVMHGFEQELRQRVLNMVSHATVTGPSERLFNWRDLAKQIKTDPRVMACAPYIEGQGMLVDGTMVAGVTIRGILPQEEAVVSQIANQMRLGQLSHLIPGTFTVLIGYELAQRLGVGLGDKVTLVSPQAMMTPIGPLPRLKRFTVGGIFQVGMYEYDNTLAFIHLQDAARLFRFGGNEVSGVRMALTDLEEAPAVIQNLTSLLPSTYHLEDWSQSHASLFHAVRTEQIVMFVILALVVGVAAFNIVAMLMMVVTEKGSDIAILRTLGLSPSGIMLIFVVQGVVIGLIGTALGLIGGIFLATHITTLVPALEHFFGVHLLFPEVYYITEVPSDLRWLDVSRAGILAGVLCVIATLYPAWRASRVAPAEALRHS